MRRLPLVFASLAASLFSQAAFAQARAPVTAAEDHVVEELREQHRHHHHGGLTMFLAMAMDTLAVPAAKKPAVQEAQDTFVALMSGSQEAERRVMEVLAQDVEGGMTDPTRAGAAIVLLAQAAAANDSPPLDVLDRLHDALSPVERAALMDKMLAHWEVWQKVNVGPSSALASVAELTEPLGLTKEQVDRILAASSVPPFETADVDKTMKLLVKGFLADHFDTTELPPESPDAWLAAAGATQMARFYEEMTPFLTAEQRPKLALHLRAHLDHSDAPAMKTTQTPKTPTTKESPHVP
jgi:hypothetical protein